MPHGFERCERGWNKDVEQRKGERNKGKCRLELTVAAALTHSFGDDKTSFIAYYEK